MVNCRTQRAFKMLLIVWILPLVSCVQFNYQGCYSSSDVQSGLTSKGSYVYQSVSYCQEQCGDGAVAALFNGNTCYCADSATFLSSLATVDTGDCNINCAGWPYDTCGGSSAMQVYVNQADQSEVSSVVSSTSSASSSSPTSTTSTSQTSSPGSSSGSSSSRASSSSSSPSSSSVPSSSSSSSIPSSSSVPSSSSSSSSASSSGSASGSSSPSSTTSSSSTPSSSASPSTSSQSSTRSSSAISVLYTTNIITTSMTTGSDQQQRTVFITTTSVVSAPSGSSPSTAATSTGANSLANKSSTQSKSGLSKGAIAGVVVGVVCGVLIIAGIIFFMLWRRHKRNEEPDLEETKQYQPYSFGDADANPVIIPTNGGPTSNWRRPSRNDLGSNESNSASFGVPTTTLSASNSISRGSTQVANIFAGEDSNHVASGAAVQLQNHPSTVFEEPPFMYQGNQRFSTGSLPDMMEDRQLRVVNPDDSLSRFDANEPGLDQQLDDDDNLTSTGSSRNSPMDHEPKE